MFDHHAQHACEIFSAGTSNQANSVSSRWRSLRELLYRNALLRRVYMYMCIAQCGGRWWPISLQLRIVFGSRWAAICVRQRSHLSVNPVYLQRKWKEWDRAENTIGKLLFQYKSVYFPTPLFFSRSAPVQRMNTRLHIKKDICIYVSRI